MAEKLLLGLDEAGRGCMMGSLCMATVIVPEESGRAKLREWGCADSKSFGSGEVARKKRGALYYRIMESFESHIEIATASKVDSYVRESSINRLEQEMARQLMKKSKFDTAVLDGKKIFSPLTAHNIEAHNKADVTHPEVSAAGIVAKHTRDELLVATYKELGFPDDLRGGGYPNVATLSLIVGYYKEWRKLPPNFRTSYRWQRLYDQIESMADQD